MGNDNHNSSMGHNLINPIRELIVAAQGQVLQAINSSMVQTYWNIGRLIVEEEQAGEQRAVYGAQQLQNLAKELTKEFGKGFDISNLRNMRAFYMLFPIQDAVRPELSWTHYRKLIRIENAQARQWYMQEAIAQNWSARALERQISVLYYERLLSSQDRAPVIEEAKEKALSLTDNKHEYLRDPYILDFLNLDGQPFLETDLEQGIINNLQKFLLELGKGFAFVARQERIRTEDQDFYLDLVFYNFKLKCFLLIDLKLGKLSHQDVGQMDTYIRIYDQHRKSSDDNPTIGLILCSQKSEAVVKYSVLTDSRQMFAAKYLDHLPTEQELKQELERERALVQEQLENKYE
jgi:predicted nuclease of restriction endonuclease-like (RecB) superfamily